MDNVGDIPINDLEISSDASDASSRIEIVNSDLPNAAPFAVN